MFIIFSQVSNYMQYTISVTILYISIVQQQMPNIRRLMIAEIMEQKLLHCKNYVVVLTT